MPLFSIITAVYNNKKYIHSCAKSVLSQSFRDIEYIIVDDGSTDGTSEIVDMIMQTDTRVKVIHQNNQWIYASFNNGIRIASGEYIYIVNSDDRLRDGILQVMADKIQRYHRPDIIWTKVLVHRCDDRQKILKYDIGNADGKINKDHFFADQESVRKNWLYFCHSDLAQNQANLYKRELMLKSSFRNDIYGADTLFNISIASYVNSAVILEEAAYDFFQYDNADMNTSIGKYYDYEHQMFNEIYMEYKQLFQNWRIYNNRVRTYLCKRRLKNLTGQIRRLQCKNCILTIDRKLHIVFNEYMDNIIFECAITIDAMEELESRVLSGVKELLLIKELSEDSEMHFVYELLDALLVYEKDVEDYRKLEHAINHSLNPMHIGKVFYKKLKQSRK